MVTPTLADIPELFHRHACTACAPWLPRGERQSEFHIAARFGDLEHPRRVPPLRVWVDGYEVGDGCFEVLAGRDGYVLVYSHPAHYCPCGQQQICISRVNGACRFETKVES